MSHILIQDDLPKRFWEIEEIPTKKMLTNEEVATCEHYDKTTTRNADGRYVVDMPVLKPTPPLGNSFKQAEQRFKA